MPLQEQWGLVLEKYGVDEFKSKAFWTVAQDGGLVGAYKGWSFERANIFISDLVRVIQRHKCHIFGAVVNLTDFFSFDEESRRFLTGATFHIQRQRFVSSGKPNSAYFMALTAVIAKAVERAATDRELCHFIFDEQEEYASLAKTRVAELREHLGRSGLADSLGDVGYSPSHRVRALQAADLVAHVCKYFYRQKIIGQQPWESMNHRGLLTPWEIFAHLLTDTNHSLFKLDRPVMEAILSGEIMPLDNPEPETQPQP
jgi:hypothetical protein